MKIEDYLHKIDSIFKEKSQKDIYLTYAMIVGGIFAFAYLLFWDSSFESFTKKNAQINNVSTQIHANKIFLQQNTQADVNRLDQEIKITQAKMLALKDTNAYIKSKIATISSLIYDERTWGEYLHSISKNAVKNNVKILDFSNKYVNKKGEFGHLLDISVSTYANFTNSLKFINSLEQSELVVDIHNIDLKTDKKITTDLNISVWGITY